MRRLESLLPALLLLLFAFALGGDAAALRSPTAWSGRLVLVVLALLGARHLLDPLRLGRGARWLPAALSLLVFASWWSSPVAGAGRTSALLLPACLLTIPALSGGFARDPDLAAIGWNAAVVAIACAALLEWIRTGGASIAAPLGRRDLLALVLATAAPLAAGSLASSGGRRALAVAATLLGCAALVATGVRWALIGYGVAALLSARRLDRGRELPAGLGLIALGLAVPGVERLLRGDSPDIRATFAAIRGAWRGAMARPLLGWGPASMPWTLPAYRPAMPGIDAVGLARAGSVPVPLQLLFELGLPALVLAGLLLALVLRARRSGPGGERFGSAGLVALAITSLGGIGAGATIWLVMTALAAGASLADESAPSPPRRWGVLVGVAYLVAIGALLLPAVRAQRAYERAAAEPGLEGQRVAIERAARLDPTFPLYEARAGWLPGPPAAERSRRAWSAAERAGAVSALWLRAGWLAHEAGEHDAVRLALQRALSFDPFAAAPPFLIYVDSDDRAVDCAARALLAEPRLLAAVDWRRHPQTRAQTLAIAARWPGIDESWRRQLLEQAEHSAPVGEEGQDWIVRFDGGASSAISTQLFSRRSWPAELARVRLDRAAAAKVHLAPAWSLASTEAIAFPPNRCAPAR